ncbi:MAG: DUF1761 domain-containing protein [Thermoanaerobaculia bacterium]
MPHINYLAVLVAGVVIFALGGLWYSPVMFAKRWVALQGKTMEEMSAGSGPMGMMYVQAFLCGIITAWVLAIVIGFLPLLDVIRALKLAAICWLGFAAVTSYGTALFSGKARAMWVIDTSYNLVSFLVGAAILAAWR